uniref:Nonstructural protein 1 n=1 Tax=Hamaparvovirinae sp. TaxID=2809447 RepID=A0AAU7P136_9VIRU
MERSRRALIGCRRFTWNGEGCLLLEKKEDLILDRQQIIHQLHILNAQTWQAGVMSITYANTNTGPVNDPKPYAACIQNIKSVKAWMMTGEHNSEGIFHVHAMALTLQRSDAFRRSLENNWFTHRVKFIDDPIEDREPILDILKMQKCHKPESLVAYMCKDPIWMCASDQHYMNILSAVYSYDLGERFRIKQQEKALKEQVTDGGNVNRIVADVLNVIYDHNCKTLEDCMKYAPEIMSQYLHRAGFASIVQNCLTFVTATSHGWSLNRIATKYKSEPTAIHKCLLHQGLDVILFDTAFYKWVTKQLPKHNTFVLWGPSNTGKSAFISGFKQCVQWGEIVNTNSFAFEGLINVTFGIWEEPLISAELAEKAKQIFEGMECSIPVKFKKPVKLPRTPILMTTNHAPWRFCTHEEEMFKNRMFIFEWLYDTSDGHLIYRNSCSSCKCSGCQGSCSSETPTNSEPISGMQGEQQSIQLVGATNTQCNVRGGPMHRTGEGQTSSTTRSRQNSGSDDDGHSSNTGRTKKQRTHSPGPSSSSSTTTSDRIRSGRPDRSSHSNIRIRDTQSGNAIQVVANIHRQHHGDDSRRDRMGESRDGDPGEGPSHSRWVSNKHGIIRTVMELAEREQTPERDEIPTSQSNVGGKMDTLTVPKKTDWMGYLSYLQNTYG